MSADLDFEQAAPPGADASGLFRFRAALKFE
jgi:hypothetical protein